MLISYSDCILGTFGIAWVWSEKEIQSDRECIFDSYLHNLSMMYIYIHTRNAYYIFQIHNDIRNNIQCCIHMICGLFSTALQVHPETTLGLEVGSGGAVDDRNGLFGDVEIPLCKLGDCRTLNGCDKDDFLEKCTG